MQNFVLHWGLSEQVANNYLNEPMNSSPSLLALDLSPSSLNLLKRKSESFNAGLESESFIYFKLWVRVQALQIFNNISIWTHILKDKILTGFHDLLILVRFTMLSWACGVVSIGRMTPFYVVLVPFELIPSEPPLYAYAIVSFCTLQKDFARTWISTY